MLAISRGISNVLTKIVLNTPRTATNCTQPVTRNAFHTYRVLNCEKSEAEATEAGDDQAGVEKPEPTAEDLKRLSKDRTKVIPVETSIKYLSSAAYKQAYGDQYVWEQYRRNHKGMFPPKKTRKTCIRGGIISTGNPCPICRDEYLVLDHRNIELLQQFVSKQSGDVLSYKKTGLCQKKHLELLVAVHRAWDRGLLVYDVPFREYDYSEYYGTDKNEQKAKQ